jgi:hypothetical protein
VQHLSVPCVSLMRIFTWVVSFWCGSKQAIAKNFDRWGRQNNLWVGGWSINECLFHRVCQNVTCPKDANISALKLYHRSKRNDS